MATPVDIVTKKFNDIKDLWKEDKVDEVVSMGYATDAVLKSEGRVYKGHDEILKMFTEGPDEDIEYLDVNTADGPDNTVVQKVKAKCDGYRVRAKLTWKKVGDDWKIAVEEWS